MGTPTRTGPWPGRPVIHINPAHPLRDLVEPRTQAVRPVLPEPEMLAYTIRGFTARHAG